MANIIYISDESPVLEAEYFIKCNDIRTFAIPKIYNNIDISDYCFLAEIKPENDSTPFIDELVKDADDDFVYLKWNIQNHVTVSGGIVDVRIRINSGNIVMRTDSYRFECKSVVKKSITKDKPNYSPITVHSNVTPKLMVGNNIVDCESDGVCIDVCSVIIVAGSIFHDVSTKFSCNDSVSICVDGVYTRPIICIQTNMDYDITGVINNDDNIIYLYRDGRRLLYKDICGKKFVIKFSI